MIIGQLPLPKDREEYQLFINRYYWRPDLFAQEILRIAELDPYFQPKLLLAPCDHLRIAVAGGKGVGKSYILGAIALWWKVTRSESMVIMYAGSLKQVKESSFGKAFELAQSSAIRDWLSINAESIRLKGDSPIHSISVQAIGHDTENAAGRHSKNMLVIADECEKLEMEQWAVVTGNATDPGAVLIASGNPTRLHVPFHKIFTEWSDGWMLMQLDATRCSFRAQESIAETLRICGGDVNSPIYRSTVLGLFPQQSISSYLGQGDLRSCRELKLDRGIYESQPAVLGIDLAYGGSDRAAFAVRKGRKLVHLEGQHVTDMVLLRQKAQELFKQFGAYKICVDITGGGKSFTDELRRHLPSNSVIDVNFAGSSGDPERWSNNRQMIWSKMRDKFRDGGFDLSSLPAPVFDELEKELASIECTIDNKGREVLPRKDVIKAMLGFSPDLSDAVALTFAIDPIITNHNLSSFAGHDRFIEHTPQDADWMC